MRTLVLALLLASTGVLSAQSRDGLTSGSRTLQDVALERRLGIRPAAPGSFSVTGAAGMPVLLAPIADSFAEVDRADTAHQPDAYANLPIYDPYFVTYGGGYNWQTRHQHHSAHVAPVRPAPPVVARPPAPPRPVQHSTSGMTGRSGSGRGKR